MLYNETPVPLGQVQKLFTVPSHTLSTSLLYTRGDCAVSTSSAKVLCNMHSNVI